MVYETENGRLPLDDMAVLATGRSSDMFDEDLRRCSSEIRSRIAERRILVLGGAGSIGASTVDLLSQFGPAALHIVDQNENALAELVRDLRSRPEGLQVADFQTLPIDCGSTVMSRFIAGQAPYDIVLNFAALKHVRSEKDVCSVLQMFDTNVLKPMKVWAWTKQRGPAPQYFSVSTDKAADPANLMGASKRLMERTMFSTALAAAPRVTSSRFANVAFSNGSLLDSFLRRLEKRQPLVSPRDTNRFFISIREAGKICLLATVCGLDRHIVIPRLEAGKDTRELSDIAIAFLRWKGLEPAFYQDEKSARANVESELLRNRYPLLLTELDTAGEKSSEIFVGDGEEAIEYGMANLLAVKPLPVPHDELLSVLKDIELLIADPGVSASQSRIVDLVSRAVPEFQHLASHKHLDQRM